MKDSLLGALSLSGFWLVRSIRKGVFVSVLFVHVPERLLISTMHVSLLMFEHMQLKIGFVWADSSPLHLHIHMQWG